MPDSFLAPGRFHRDMSAPDARPGPSDDGANQVWGLICTLVAGPAVWGAVGLGADRLAGTAVLTPVGVVVGFVTSLYVVYVKAVREPVPRTTPDTTTTRTTGTAPIPEHGRSEVPPGGAARPDADRPDRGDVR